MTERENDALERRLAALTPAQRSLLERILAEGDGTVSGVRRRPEAAAVEAPVSFEQERLWFMNELVAYRAIFHVPTALRLRGPLDVAALRRAINRLVERHEALRTVFREGEDGPRQVVLDGADVRLTVVDCQDAPDPEGEARRLASESVGEPFDLRAGPLLRCRLYRTGPDDHLFLLTQHHIVSDYWSLGILLEDLGVLYAGETGHDVKLPPLDLHYPDFAYWQREAMGRKAVEEQLAYWRDRLADAPESLDLPADRPRPAIRGSQGRFHHVEFPAELVSRLRDLARENSTTLLVVFLAGYFGLLSRLVRQDTIVVGVPIAGRSRPELQRMLGYFLNWLAIRVRVDDRPSLRQLVQRTAEALTEAMRHQDVPFDVLVHELQPVRRPGLTPIFQTSFSLRDGAPTPPKMPGMDVDFAPLDGGATHFDLMAELWCEEDCVIGYLPYDDELFEESTVASYALWLRRLLESGTAEPGRPVATLPLLTVSEQARLIGDTPADLGEAGTTLHARFAEQAARRPGAIAVSDETAHLSYAELDERANRIANALRERGVVPGSIVGLVLDRTADLVAAVLGVLKCGAAYLPVDPDSPAERASAQFAGCSAAAVLVAEDLTARFGRPERSEDRPNRPSGAWGSSPSQTQLPEHRPSTVRLDWAAPEFADATPVQADVPSSSPAYVIYTSGSTGAPKGVLVSHANVLSLFAASRRLFEIREDDTWTLFHSYAFDFSVWELWGALAHGGRLVVVPQWVTRAPDAFADLLERERVTVLSQTPSAFGQLTRVVLAGGRQLPLRYVVFGGEALDHSALRGWIEAFGDEHPHLINMYGITETTVHVTFRRVTRPDVGRGQSLIGRRLPHLALYLLDDELQPVPPGIPGEIFVGGAGVALGYQRAPGLTAERMLPDPYSPCPGARMYRSGDFAVLGKDGELAYLGRGDGQHKIRGHRVELGEVQAALNRLDEVAESGVLVTADRVGGKTLVAYVVPAPDREVTPTRIRRSLLRTLPDWMVPSTVVLLDKLPLTRNGKLDQRALTARQREQTTDRMPSTPPEGETAVALARIWRELLAVERVGAQDNFFELGGHSLMVVQLVTKVRVRLGVEVPMEILFRHPELQAMADALSELGSAPATTLTTGPFTEADLAAVDADITARLAHLPRTDALPPGRDDVVLLTGATGFVGAFTLAELLSRGTNVVCLLRGGESRRDELVRRLEGYGLWNAGYEAFLEIVEGDVSRPGLGIAPGVYAELCDRVGKVIHSAAWVNHLYPYEQLAPVNTHSVGGLLEFASTSRRKSLAFVSTSAVFEPTAYPEGVEIGCLPLVALPPETNGYVRSKAVAERYFEHARELGVPAVIVRIPSVFGDRERFQINTSDAIWSWTKAIVTTGRHPSSFDDPGNELFQALPADAVARVLVETGGPQDAPGSRIVNAIPNTVCGTRGLLDGIRLAGHDPLPMDDREWYALVGTLDAGEIWVAGIAAQLAASPDPGALRGRLHRFRTDEEPAVSALVGAQAVSSPEDVAAYVRTLLGDGG